MAMLPILVFALTLLIKGRTIAEICDS